MTEAIGQDDAPDLFRDDGHDELVHRRAEQEGEEHGRLLGQLVARHGRRVDMTQQERVHGFVPLARELVPGGRVPPIRGGGSVRGGARYRDRNRRDILQDIDVR